jgi:hypothetical protein
MAGRPRKPTKLHVLQGTRPGATTRDRAAEPECAPLGEPPAHWTAAVEAGSESEEKAARIKVAIWHEIVAALPPGVITEADRFTVEIAVELLVRLRLGLTSAAEIGNLQRALASLGMTPADRSKVGVKGGDAPKASGWDRLGAPKAGA